jgi:hypothetical protein
MSSERKRYGKPSPGKELFLSTDADKLHDVLDMIDGWIKDPKAIDVKGLTEIKKWVSEVKDPHYSGGGTECRPPT